MQMEAEVVYSLDSLMNRNRGVRYTYELMFVY